MDLYAQAEELGVVVRYSEYMSRWGRYDHDTRTIWLLSGMGVPQWRTTLAHECGHAYWGHETDCPKNERLADEYAVSLLIPPWDWARATAYAGSVESLAQELGVLPRLVLVAHDIYQHRTPCGT